VAYRLGKRAKLSNKGGNISPVILLGRRFTGEGLFPVPAGLLALNSYLLP